MPGGSATACVLHKAPGMVDLVTKCCDHPGGECHSFPRFGPPGIVPANRCSVHQEPGMVPKLCQFTGGCNNYPSYGCQGDPASMCCRHKADGMERKALRFCNPPGGCRSYPVYGLPGGLATRCSIHREPGSIDMVIRRCGFPGGCDKTCGYGFGSPAVRCSAHMEPGMGEVKKLRCEAAAAALRAGPSPVGSSLAEVRL